VRLANFASVVLIKLERHMLFYPCRVGVLASGRARDSRGGIQPSMLRPPLNSKYTPADRHHAGLATDSFDQSA
jgi:hypothetical protein